MAGNPLIGGYAIGADAVASIEAGARLGESYRRIAASVGVSAATARRYALIMHERDGVPAKAWRSGLVLEGIDPALVAEIEARAADSQTVAAIAHAVGVSEKTARKYASPVRCRLGLRERGGVPANSALVAEIERRHSAGDWPATIAADLGIDHKTATKHVQRYRGREGLPPLVRRRADQPKLAPTMVAGIERLADKGALVREIADELGVPKSTVAKYARLWRIRTGSLAARRLKARPLTSADAKAFRLTQQGLPHADIAVRLGMAAGDVRKAVQRVRRQAGTKGEGGVAFSKEKIARIERLAARGLVAGDIADELGISLDSVYRYRRAMVERLGERAPTCGCGKPVGHRQSCPYTAHRGTGEIEADIAAMVRAGETGTDIAKAVGVSPHAVARVAAPIIADMRAAGETCWCGREFGHRQRCALARSPRQNEIVEIRKRLARGTDEADVAEAVKAPRRVVRLVVALMSGQTDGVAREVALKALAARRPSTAQAQATQRDALYAKISRQVPREYAADLRDDIIADIYEAVMAGRFRASQVGQHARQFAKDAVARWADGFGQRDIDAPIGGDGRSYVEVFEDSTASAEIDSITIGGGE